MTSQVPVEWQHLEFQTIFNSALCFNYNPFTISFAVTIPTRSGVKGTRRVDYCLYCNRKATFSILKHLSLSHRQEVEIKAAMREPKKSKERKLKIWKIVNQGNFKHNREVTIDMHNT